MSNQPTGVEAMVCNDIAKRQKSGVQKYGTTVADNPLDLQQWLQHAYEECLDQAVYLRRAMVELDRQNAIGEARAESAAPPVPLARSVFGFLDFRERAVNHASFYYGAATTLATLYVIQCWANNDPWAGAKGIAACLAGKLCHLRHPLKSEGPPTATSDNTKK